MFIWATGPVVRVQDRDSGRKWWAQHPPKSGCNRLIIIIVIVCGVQEYPHKYPQNEPATPGILWNSCGQNPAVHPSKKVSLFLTCKNLARARGRYFGSVRDFTRPLFQD